MSQELVDYFNKQPRLMTLSTADKEGNVNAAYFGSPHMIDAKTVVMGSGTNKTLANLKENPKACFTVMEPGPSAPEWKGVRLYVKMTECATSGRKLDDIRAAVAQKVGPETAKQMIHAALTFEIEEIRPLADFGQGWEKSIG
jgi:predicted pyridoxine 5'-phosphate oxidase superfamily flavin-nucleotide-binding protein